MILSLGAPTSLGGRQHKLVPHLGVVTLSASQRRWVLGAFIVLVVAVGVAVNCRERAAGRHQAPRPTTRRARRTTFSAGPDSTIDRLRPDGAKGKRR